MTQQEFDIYLLQAERTMKPLCGHKIKSTYECHVIVNLIDGGSFEKSIQMCGICRFNNKYPEILKDRITTIGQEFING